MSATPEAIEKMRFVKPQYWKVIGDARGQTSALRKALGKLIPEELLAFAAHVWQARDAVRPMWNGPVFEGTLLSEDATGAFTNWIVAQGYDAWHAATGGLSDGELGPMRERYMVASYDRQDRRDQGERLDVLIDVMGELEGEWQRSFRGEDREDDFYESLYALMESEAEER